MERVIVTVERAHEVRGRDLEIPAEIESFRLAELIAAALGWENDAAGQPVRYTIRAEPLGRVLSSHESLADAGAWDGSRLVLQPIENGAPVPRSSSRAERKGPVEDWKSLGIDLPGPAAPEQPAPEGDKSQSGFVWKRLD